MSRLPAEVDVAIIGAGAAGLGAAQALKSSKLSVLVLEARNRIGGRAHTVSLPGGIVFDEGCGWLHAANLNSFVPIAEQLGFEIDKSPPPWERPPYNPNLLQEDTRAFPEAIKAFHENVRRLAQGEKDCAASAALEEGSCWNGALNNISTYYSGAALEKISVKDLANYEETDLNWRVLQGYGALIASYGSECPIVLNAQVGRIDHGDKCIRIETGRGVLEAKAAIIAIPTNLIAQGKINFFPPLPDKIAAASGLPLGIANKVMLACDHAEDLPKGGFLLDTQESSNIGSHHLRPFGKPCIESYFGGDFAVELEREGAVAMAAQAIEEISQILGNEMHKRLKLLTASRWAFDPFALGSYSYSKPGHAGDRAALAAPVDNRLFFAGEATSLHAYSTAHGARDSGERAAREVLEVFE